MGSQLDVVIPVHPKDFGTVELVAASARASIPGVRKLFVVSSESFVTRLPFVTPIREPTSTDFLTLVEVRSRWERENPSLAHRAGWLYQQILNLGASAYIDDLLPTYLCIDADTIFLRQVQFMIAGKRFVYADSRYPEHRPYLEAYRRLTGEEPLRRSFTMHHMLYAAELLTEMFAQIEERHGKPWFRAYLDSIDYGEAAGINEQDTYGSWVMTHHPELAMHRPLTWKDQAYVPNRFMRRRLARRFDFVSAHAYMRHHGYRIRRARYLVLRMPGWALRRLPGVRRLLSFRG